MSRWFYQFVLLIARPLVHVRLWRRARKEPEYGQRKAERFGHVPAAVTAQPVWFHTVSAGETLAAVPLIAQLREAYAQLPFLVTTMTPTGSSQVLQRLPQVDHCYAPYDFRDAVERFFTRVQPRVLILMETELWPNMIAAAARRQVPVVLINARLSARSARGYSRVAGLTRHMLTHVQHIACQTAEHRDRFIGLGAPVARVSVTGSVKYDLQLDAFTRDAVQGLQQRYDIQPHTPVWIAASTHPGEDERVLACHSALRERIAGLRLILVPRHPVRCDDVQTLVAQHNWSYVRQSQCSDRDRTAEVIIGDEMGTLLQLYGLAQVAFVGGSLTDVGGHNPVEPALFQLPMVCGPFQYNFTDAMNVLAAAGALRTVTSVEDMQRALGDWLANPAARQAAGAAAAGIVDANRGAQARIRELVGGVIEAAVAQ